MREDLYVSDLMMKLKRFSVENLLSTHLVAHQNKPEKMQEDKNYPPPDIYKIKGGGTFADKCDNALSVYRPYRRSDETNPLVIIESQKIKKKKLTGSVGEAEFFYSWQRNQYQDTLLNGKSPMELDLAKI